MKDKISFKVSDLIGIICMIIGAGVLIRTACFVAYTDIWFDELFTVELAMRPLPEMMALAAQDVHPPLYYMIVRLVYIILHALFGTDIVVAAKITSLVPYVLTAVYMLTYIRRRFGFFAAGAGMLMIEVMPRMSVYMVEARMYSWSAFALLAMYIHAAEYLDEESSSGRIRHMIAVFVYGVAAMYLHYYSLIGAGIIALGLVVISIVRYRKSESAGRRGSLIALLICMAAAIVAYIPWISAMLGQVGAVSASYWIPPVSLRTVAGCVKYIFKPEFERQILSYLCVAVMVGGYACMLVLYIRGKKNKYDILYILGAPVTVGLLILAGLIASILIRPVFVYRYLMPVMYIFWLGVAVLIGHMIDATASRSDASAEAPDRSDARTRIISGILLVCLLIVLAASGIRSYNLFRWEEMRKSQGIETTSAVLDDINKNRSDTLIVCNFNHVQALMWYYLDCDSMLWGYTDETLIAEICDRAPIVMADDPEQLKEALRERGQTSFLFFGSGNAREEIIDLWDSYGFFTELLQDSCFLERYYFNIYEVTLN